MTICKYCHDAKMSMNEYENYEKEIKRIAGNIRKTLAYNNGIYFETNSIPILKQCEPTLKNFIIQELKKLDIEFYNNNEEYRVTC